MIWNKQVRRSKTHGQDAETNDDKEIQADKIDDKTHTKCKVNMGNRLNIPVDELKLGADDDTSMLATQETSATNIPEGKLGTTKNV